MPAEKEFITRFAPSPTGRLHLGHAYSALLAYERAREEGGRFLLRIEDIDRGRSKAEFETGIYEDLAWLGLAWDTPVRRQSEHMDDYRAALAKLGERGLLYSCFCTRRDIRREIEASPSAPHGAEGPLYPGTCRNLEPEARARRMDAGKPYALRLDLGKAMDWLTVRNRQPVTFADEVHGLTPVDPAGFGDVVLARKDIGTSYHLSVAVDDALQGVTHVIRGEDLLPSTHVHRVLQALLDLPEPRYHHHGLLYDGAGNRLAKRDKSITIRALREKGHSPEEVRRMARPGKNR